VPFGGQYRLIDFALSNLVNAGFHRIIVLTQYKSQSLHHHIARAWPLSAGIGQFVTTVPAQMREGPHWFSGSADAIYQNLEMIREEASEYVAVFAADHVYRMDPARMLTHHIDAGNQVTVAAVSVPASQASSFGVMEVSPTGRVQDFFEKPTQPIGNTVKGDSVYASMGNYIFDRDALIEAIQIDAADTSSGHDLGGDIIPSLVKHGVVGAYDFASDVVPGQGKRERGYWRDVGSIDAYYQASMDLISVEPVFNLYNQAWPIYTYQEPLPPSKTVHEGSERSARVFNSLMSGGVIVSGGTVRRSVLGPLVRIHSHAVVEDSVLMSGVSVGEGAFVRNAILGEGVVVPPGAHVIGGLDADTDQFTLSEDGVLVVGAGDKVA
jgi:glucose-1-phosphate adenylyltransferase